MLKLLSLFSGIGAFEKALTNIDEPFEVVNYCEIDKYASKAYSLIHNIPESKNLHDVTTIDTSKLPTDIDILTYGFPCQDISTAGKQRGLVDENGNRTRSGLFFEALRIIQDVKPKIAIAENVKALTGKKFKLQYSIVLNSLINAGYVNYAAVLNAKNYGVPQNRERVFIISIRKDIDHGFTFPQHYELKKRLKDVLEETVDEKYFLSEKAVNGLILTREKCIARGNGFFSQFLTGEDISSSLTTKPTHSGSDYLLIKTANKQGYDIAENGDYVNLAYPESETRRGRVGHGVSQTLLTSDQNGVVVEETDKVKKLFNIYGENHGGSFVGNVYDQNGISPALLTMQGGNKQPLIIETVEVSNALTTVQKDALLVQSTRRNDNIINELKNNTGLLRIRRFTPKECFRLMGFNDADVDILSKNGISNTQLYKMAGNSIVVDVLEELFVELLNQYEDVFPVGG